MAPNAPAGTDHRPVLGSEAFRYRLDEEVARIRRSGGFLSLAMFRAVPGGAAIPPADPLAQIAERLRRSVRLEDVLAQRPQRVVLLMPDTSAGEGARAAERLLAVIGGGDSGSPGRRRSRWRARAFPPHMARSKAVGRPC